MRILLDQNVPKRLRHALPRHDVRTAREMDWSTLSNGALLAAAEAAGFDVMVTADQNLPSQPNLKGRSLSVVVLSSNKWLVIESAFRPISEAVERSCPGRLDFVDLGLL